MADWIHLDKTSGTGPAEVRVTADINETGEIRQATYKVIKEGTKEEKTFLCLGISGLTRTALTSTRQPASTTPASRTWTASWLVGVNSTRPRRSG